MRIGVFDSGVGGLTVLSELCKRFPGASFVYFGDTAHVPYGTKSPKQIIELSRAAARQLRAHKLDLLVVACNTASSWALPEIQKVMGRVPVRGVVEAGVQAVLDAHEKGDPVIVFATSATIRSGIYGRTLRTLGVSKVREKACPLLVPMIEEGWLNHRILKLTVAEYVQEVGVSASSEGVALLGCTHYPWIHRVFQKQLVGWQVVNSAQAIAAQLFHELGELGAAGNRRQGRAPFQVEWHFSDPQAVPLFAQKFLKRLSASS